MCAIAELSAISGTSAPVLPAPGARRPVHRGQWPTPFPALQRAPLAAARSTFPATHLRPPLGPWRAALMGCAMVAARSVRKDWDCSFRSRHRGQLKPSVRSVCHTCARPCCSSNEDYVLLTIAAAAHRRAFTDRWVMRLEHCPGFLPKRKKAFAFWEPCCIGLFRTCQTTCRNYNATVCRGLNYH